jgi:hypothetical protein
LLFTSLVKLVTPSPEKKFRVQILNTDAQSAGLPKHTAPTTQGQHSSPSLSSRNHARGSLGSLGLASLFACCYAPFSLGWFEIRVATSLTSIGRASRSPNRVSLVCYAKQCTGAGRCSLLVVAARTVRRRVIGPRIVRCLVSIGRPARNSAYWRSSRFFAGVRCRSPRLAAPQPLLFKARTLPQQKKGNLANMHAGQRK